MRLVIAALILSTACQAQVFRQRPYGKLNIPKTPKEYRDNEDRDIALMIGASVATVGAVGFLAKKEQAPEAVAVAGLGVGFCVYLYARRWEKKNKPKKL